MKNQGNTILLIGGGAGIGRGLAHKWHDAGNTVIVAARTLEDLQETAEGRDNLHYRQIDVADPQSSQSCATQVIAQFPDLNVVVSCAGILPYEDITRTRDLEPAEKTVAINLLGPIRVANTFIEHLRGADDAALINVTSGLGFVPMPQAATYSATKAALHSYTASLRAMLEGIVEVIEVVPPGVQTEITPGQSKRDGYMPLDEYVEEAFALLQTNPTPPEICVERVNAFRNAEAEGRFDDHLAMVAETSEKFV